MIDLFIKKQIGFIWGVYGWNKDQNNQVWLIKERYRTWRRSRVVLLHINIGIGIIIHIQVQARSIFLKVWRGGGGNLIKKKLWRAKRKKEKKRILKSWKVGEGDSTIIQFYMCKIQINVCTMKRESGEPGPHHPSPPAAMPRA